MDKYPNDIHPDYPVATVYGADGAVVDYVAHQEAARSYASCGYRVKVHQGHDGYTHAELQEAVDRELAGATVRP